MVLFTQLLAYLVLFPQSPSQCLEMKIDQHIAFLKEFLVQKFLGLPWWLNGKESACQCRRHGFNPWVGKIPWKRKWQPTWVFLPGKSHGQRSLVGYSPWGHKKVRHDLATKHQQTIRLLINAISFSRGSSWPRSRTWVSHIAGRFLTIWATREAQLLFYLSGKKPSPK